MRYRAYFLALMVVSSAIVSSALAQKEAGGQNAQKQAIKPQSEVAAKAAFKTVAATDPAVAKALDAKEIERARKLVDKNGAFKGTVTKVYTPKNNTIVILDFAPKFNEALIAALKPADYSKFPRMDLLEGKRVLVTGKFVLYKDKPEIVLTRPEQVKVIK